MNIKWFESSSGSGDLSLTIKGILTSLVPLVVIGYKFAGYEIPQADVEQIIVVGSSIVSSAMILSGLIRKIYYTFKSK